MQITEKEMRRLGRAKLLELLIRASKENAELNSRILQLENQLEQKELAINSAGSLAEASLAITKIFEEADKAVQVYTNSMKQANINQRLITQTIIADAERTAAKIIAEAQLSAPGQSAGAVPLPRFEGVFDTSLSSAALPQPTPQATPHVSLQAAPLVSSQPVAQPTPHASSQLVPQSMPQPVLEPLSQPSLQPVAQPVMQPQPAPQPMAQPQPAAQPMAQPQPAAQPMSQPVPQPAAQPMMQSITQASSQTPNVSAMSTTQQTAVQASAHIPTSCNVSSTAQKGATHQSEESISTSAASFAYPKKASNSFLQNFFAPPAVKEEVRAESKPQYESLDDIFLIDVAARKER